MTISKLDYARKMDRLGDCIRRAGEEYGGIPKRFEIKSEEDIVRLKEEWLSKVADFRTIQNEINLLEIPVGYDKEGQKIQDAYKRYVDLIEEKTIKYGLESMKSGELERINQWELKAAHEFRNLVHDLGVKMFI